jgi:serine phosphatase RsbU (regulator of sigma subunit)
MDEAMGRVLHRILMESHTIPPDELPSLGHLAGQVSGFVSSQMYLVDYGGRRLVPLRAGEEALSVEGTIGGRAYATGAPVEVAHDGSMQLWCPLIDGIDRIGVVMFELEELDDDRRQLLMSVASLMATETVARGQYTDSITKVRRLRPLSLSAELQWSMLPPASFSTRDVRVAAALEPSYTVAGDAYDYAYNSGMLRAAVVDAMGHDLASTLLSGLVIGGLRHARRRGADLVETVLDLDRLVSEHVTDEMFATGVFTELNVATGGVRIVTAGHAPPLLLRDGRVAGPVEGGKQLPLGLGDLTDSALQTIELEIQPDDRLLLYSDGIVEAHRAGGPGFGVDRLSDFVQVQLASGLPDSEVIRRLIHAVADHYDSRLGDDATVLLVHWNPGNLG